MTADLAHLASDADGIASLVILIVVPGTFVVAELIARRRHRQRAQADDPQAAGPLT